MVFDDISFTEIRKQDESRIAAFRDRYTSAALLSVCMSSLSITPYQLVKRKRLICCHLQEERWFLEKIGHHD